MPRTDPACVSRSSLSSGKTPLRLQIQPTGAERQAEIDDHQQATPVGHDVRGLEIAMHDAAAVGLFHGQGQHADQRGDGPLRQGVAALKTLGERLPVEQGHGQVIDAVYLVHSKDRAQIGVVEGGRGAGLAIEPLQDFGAVFGAQVRDLEGDLAMYL